MLAISLLTASCRPQAVSTRAEYQMGEKVPAGPLTYNVVEKVWRSQLGEMFQTRMPQNRFLVITISATNGGGSEVSVPLLQLDNFVSCLITVSLAFYNSLVFCPITVL